MTTHRLKTPFKPLLMIILALFSLTVQGCFHSSDNDSDNGPTNAAPVFTSGTAISVAENIIATGYTATATDADGDGDIVTFELSGGTDEDVFSIDNDSGVLSFSITTDVDNPVDDNGDNNYAVNITATDGTNSVVQTVTVTVIAGANPTGYYTNNGFVNVKAADDTTQRLVNDIQGMVANGQLMMLSDSENIAYIGTFTVSGNDFSGSVTVYEAGAMVQQDVSVTGLITEGSSLTGTLGGSGVANGTFKLNYAEDNGPVDLAQLERDFTWFPVDNLNIPNLDLRNPTQVAPADNISAAGVGSNIFDGCSYRGRIDPIAGTHLYTVSVTMVNPCTGAATGVVDAIPAYTGLASVRGTDRFVLALSNGEYDFSGEYFECLVLLCTPQ